MGPLVAERRLHAMDTFVSDAIAKGAKIRPAASARATRATSTSPP
jgi:hypothetical protein